MVLALGIFRSTSRSPRRIKKKKNPTFCRIDVHIVYSLLEYKASVQGSRTRQIEAERDLLCKKYKVIVLARHCHGYWRGNRYNPTRTCRWIAFRLLENTSLHIFS